MMANKEKNFVSAVVYICDDSPYIENFLQSLSLFLQDKYEKYEIICVNDASVDGSTEKIKAFSEKTGCIISIIHMGIRQGRELCMNAGLDLAIGDFVFECDSVKTAYPAELYWQAYEECLTGYDIVNVCPAKNRALTSSLFYTLFNKYSSSPYPIQTSLFQLVSRRAINRVRAISPILPYRKAAYAESGLRVHSIICDDVAVNSLDAKDYRQEVAIDSLILYTNTAMSITLGVSFFMLMALIATVVYIFIIYFGYNKPITGWTTTMLLLTGSFFAIFLILSVMIKYLSILVNLSFKKNKYLIESIEKIAK